MKNTIVTIVVAIFIGIVGYNIAYFTSRETIHGKKIVDLERIVESSGEETNSKYLVYTNDEVFENTDEFILWKFNSSDIQNQLAQADSVNLEVIGWRIPFLSMYRNIVEIK